MNKAVDYVRVSSRKQALNGYSLENQHELAKKLSQVHEFELVETFVDKAISVSKGSKKQTAYREMMAYCEENGVKRIYAYHIDRLGRTRMEIFKFFDWATTNKIDICTTANGFMFDMSKEKQDINTTIILNTFTMMAEVEGILREERVALAREKAYNEDTGKFDGYGPKSRRVDCNGKTTLSLIDHNLVAKLLKQRADNGGISINQVAYKAKCSEGRVWQIKRDLIATGELKVT